METARCPRTARASGGFVLLHGRAGARDRTLSSVVCHQSVPRINRSCRPRGDVENHVIAPDTSVICGDAEEGLADGAIGRQGIVKTLLSREVVGPIVLGLCKKETDL